MPQRPNGLYMYTFLSMLSVSNSSIFYVHIHWYTYIASDSPTVCVKVSLAFILAHLLLLKQCPLFENIVAQATAALNAIPPRRSPHKLPGPRGSSHDPSVRTSG